MPRGDEEEIAVRDRELFRFVALLATRALLERPTLNPSLIRDQPMLMARIASKQARSDAGATPKAAYICEFGHERTFPIQSFRKTSLGSGGISSPCSAGQNAVISVAALRFAIPILML
jgi:hypothetical protein